MAEKKLDWRSVLEAVVADKRRDLGPHPDLDEIVAYRAGGLGDEDAGRLQDHLVLCPECARLLLELDAFAADAAAPAGPQVVSLARHRAARRRRWVAVAAAAAAAVLFAVWPRGARLPGYRVDVEGETRPTRTAGTGGAEDVSVFVAGSRLAVRLKPETAAEGPVTARAYLRHGGELRALSAATLEVDGNGVVSLEGAPGVDLQLPSGGSELWLAVARPGALPSRRRLQDELTSGDQSRGRRWAGFKRRIRIVEPDVAAVGAPAAGDEGPWIEYAGCRTILVGPICILREDEPRLTVWVRHHPDEEIRTDAGAWRQSHPAARVQDGYRYEIEVGRRTSVLVVEVGRRERRSIWALELARAPEPEWLARARELYDGGEWDEARRLLEPRIAGPDPEDAGSALSLLARIERRSGHAEAGDADYRQAVAAHRQAGRLYDQIKDASALTYYLIQEKRFAEARELLDSLPVAAAGGSSEARYIGAYFHGLLAEETGDLRAAMSWMTRAAREAEKAGMSRELIFAEDILARQLQTVGLVDAAAALYSEVREEMTDLCPGAGRASELSACDCARLLVSRAWARLLSREAGDPAADPSSLLAEAERIFNEEAARGGESCLFAEDLPNVRLNLALAALQERDAAGARRHLTRAAADARELPRLALWQLDVEARIQLLSSQPGQALALYEELAERARLSSSPEAAWRAAYGRATALDALGGVDEAIAACAEAEELLDRQSLLVPIHAGRDRFIAQRDVASRFCVDLLLRAGRDAEALAAVRRSAARALRHLRVGARIADLEDHDRGAWERTVTALAETRDEIEGLAARIWKGLPRDEEERLRQEIERRRRALLGLLDRLASLAGNPEPSGRDPSPPAEGSVLLAYYPLPRGWAAFAADRDGVTVRRVAELSREDWGAEKLSALFLEPFAAKIRRAEQVRVIAYGALRPVDFHALPFAGGILLSHAPVVYPLDLAEPPAAAPASSLALVLSGPGLREAPREAREVLSALESSAGAWRAELLTGEAASEPEVRRRLPDAALFHYAGHAAFDDDSRGWDSHLALAGGGRLTVDDVLALPRVPRWVVLSGCETGRDSRRAPRPSIGLAQAFLVAGAEAVVAATADVADADAAALMSAFYRHWDGATPLAVALRKAQLERRELDPESDWQDFRILHR